MERPKNPPENENSVPDQSVRCEMRDQWINVSGSGYQPNLHGRQGNENNAIAPSAGAPYSAPDSAADGSIQAVLTTDRYRNC
jgi:hypothetical protein